MSSNQLTAVNPMQALMSPTGSDELNPARSLSFLDKLGLWVSWGVAAAIFLTLGWMAMAPDDPYGAVSLLTRGRAASMWLQAAGLALVTSAIATILVGRKLPFAGPFAAALGLAIVSLRGGTSESLLIAARGADGGTKSLAIQMAFEALAWIGVVAMAFVIGEAIAKWCLSYPQPSNDTTEVPAARRPAFLFALAALAAALLAFNILGAGMHSREIRHTQVCFVIGASAWIGCYVAFRFVPTLAIVWYFAAAVLLPLAGYGSAALQSDSPTLPMSVPPSIFLRVLPIQFVTLALLGCIAAYWSNLHHHMEVEGRKNGRGSEGS